MPPPAASNIRAFVQWKEPTVYAGEEIECIITFKNIARPPGSEREEDTPTTIGAAHNRRASLVPAVSQGRKNSVGQVKPLPGVSRAASITSARGGPPNRGHRPTLSLNVVSAAGRSGALQSAPLQQNAPPNSAFRPGKGHARSLSIMSMGSEQPSDGRTASNPQAGKRPVKFHARSASLQHTPKLMQSPASLNLPSPRQPSPLYEATTPPALPEQQLPLRPPRRRPGTVSADNTPQLGRQPSGRNANGRAANGATLDNFKFPPDPVAERSSSAELDVGAKPKRTPSTMHSGQKRSYSPRPPDVWQGGANSLNPLSRVMSETSMDGTPRTSSDLYSMSNHSDETLTSELPPQQQLGRLLPKVPHSRQTSRSPSSRPAEPETLMLAYVQTLGHFTLDGSLANAAPFEEVKRKGVQGGGGVVGVERSKRSSGLFGALSWGHIGESLGGLLGGDEMSSMAQMKASAGSKTIPLLSTPQSLLFVDLRLAPGESKSYSYRFPLPRGLPPSHRGRAIKVTYHLSLGVQRPSDQLVKHVEVPFRVLGSYDSRGDALGHDLMSPYVLLQDAARTSAITPNNRTPSTPIFLSLQEGKSKKGPKQGLEDFLRYTERLVESPTEANGVLLSPTSPTSPVEIHQTLSRQGSLSDQASTSIKAAIDFAILRANVVNPSGKNPDSQSANRFNIARSGQLVAVLTILRAAYRLGEAVTGAIDFTAPPASSDGPSQVPTYSVLIELESSEQIDPSLALRSAHSISRVTRKVYSASRENTLFARRVSFNLAIPSSAAPSFETTGVSLMWRLKVEFTTHRQVRGLGIEGGNDELLEELARDDRGTTLIAKERLPADTFEIAVPLKVYGAVGIDSVSNESEPLFV